MEHSAALPGTLPATGPKRPGWLRTTGRTLAALIVSTLGVRLAVGLMGSVGFLPEDSVDTSWPLPAEDVWALATDLSLVLITSVALALCLRWYMERNEPEWDLRFWPLAAVAALLFAVGEQRIAVGGRVMVDVGFIAFVVLVVVARQLAPVPRTSDRRGRSSSTVLGVGGAVALLVAMTYQPLHPLAFDSSRSQTEPIHDGHGLYFNLASAGVGGARVRSIDVVGDGRAATLVEVDHQHDHGAVSSYRPLAGGVSVLRGELLGIRVRVAPSACRGERRAVSTAVSAIEVHLDTLGLARTQRFEVDPPARLRCR